MEFRNHIFLDGNVFNSYEKCRDPEYYYSDEAKSGLSSKVYHSQKGRNPLHPANKFHAQNVDDDYESDTAYPQPYDIWDEDPIYAKNQLVDFFERLKKNPFKIECKTCGKVTSFKWSKQAYTWQKTIRPQVPPNIKEPIDFFKLLFTNELLNETFTKTNNYDEEINMGTMPLTNIQEYWSTNNVSHIPFYPNTFTRDRKTSLTNWYNTRLTPVKKTLRGGVEVKVKKEWR
ncbi:piggyBac transposable element-derived protein 4-like [Vespula maculifrons]|uniref:PiggyBac transposable element-derived protein 4-like n=1 Tax=Vespula maculifrons TaxID=7453 RepID=A0ABD2CFF1_VESMC